MDWDNFLRNLWFVLKGIHGLVNESICFSKENFVLHLGTTGTALSPMLDFSLVAQFCNATEQTSAVWASLDKLLNTTGIKSADFHCMFFIVTSL